MKTEKPILVTDGAAYDACGLVHRVWEPDDDAVEIKGAPRPAVVMVHGRAGNEDVTWVFQNALPKNWLLISPRAPYTDPLRGYSWHVRGEQAWSSVDDFDPAVTQFNQFLTALPNTYNVDLSRTHFLGFSQGSALLYTVAARYPEKVKCMSALVGFMPAGMEDSPYKENLRDKRVFMAVGRNDDTIPLTQSQRCANVLISAGTQLDYREYETGHKLNRAGMSDLRRWWSAVAEDSV